MTKEQVLDAVREELIEANKQLDISDKLTDRDYTFIGVVASSMERIPPPTLDTMDNVINAITSNRMREWTDERVKQAMQEWASIVSAEKEGTIKELREALEEILDNNKNYSDIKRIAQQALNK